MPTPEELARINIDKQLAACGWTVQDMSGLNRYASFGIAVREIPLATGEADYLLFVDGKALGVIEAKPEGTMLSGVAEQAAHHVVGLVEGPPGNHTLASFSLTKTASRLTPAIKSIRK